MSAGKKQRPPMRIQNVFIFLLLAIFAVSAIFLTALSARVYRDTVESAQRNNASRVVTAIIRGAAQGDDSGIVSVREENGIPVLLFTHDYDGEIYYRRLYCAEGYLWDSLAPADREFDPEEGEQLIAAASFQPEIKDHMLHAGIVLPDGTEEQVDVYLRAGGAAE